MSDTVSFSYEEPLKRSWTHEILNFRIGVPKIGTDLSTLYVTDETGRIIPAQFSDPVDHYEYKEIPITISLIADLEPWQKRTWTLHYGCESKPEIPEVDLKCTEIAGGYIIENGLIAVRTGRGEKHFDQPVDAGAVTAPLVAVRGLSGKWIGRGWLESLQKINSYRIVLTHDGPIFKRVRAEYNFEGGLYICTLTLRSGEDVVHIREEFDLGTPSIHRDSNFCFSLYEGLRPDTVRWAGRYDDKRYAVNNPAGGYEKQQEAYFPIDYNNPGQLLRLHGLFIWWPQGAGYYSAYRQGEPDGDFIGVFPERPGHWSNPTVIFLETSGNPSDLFIKAPIRQPEQDWVVDGVDYNSPYFIGSMAPGTIRNRGVREWGILFSTPAKAIADDDDSNRSAVRIAMSRYSHNPLDKIKEWTLDWPDPGVDAYPRGYITRAELPALRERAKRIAALQDMLKDPQRKPFAYLVTQDPEIGYQLLNAGYDVTRNFGAPTDDAGLLTRLRWSVSCYLDIEGDCGIHTCMHHGNYHLIPAGPLFDVAMSVPAMTPEERREARALYAFLIYKLSDPDWLAYGTGFHLGTPNMPTMSLSVIGATAAIIPEHPMAYDWMMRSAKNILDMLGSFVAPGGAWRECPHYQMDASLIGVIQSATVFKNAGFLDLFRNEKLKATVLYNAQLLTPVDPRLGIRTMPAIGNGSHEPTSIYGRMAAGTAASDQEYSSRLQWAWEAIGKQYWYAHDEMNCNEDLPANPLEMQSRHFPGFGSVMRSHFGDPNETYLLFRMGYQHEHYENEQGEIVLYAKGVPLVLDFGSQYEPMMLRPWMHNRISLNHMLDEKALGQITETDFLEAADACLGQMAIASLQYCPDDPKENVIKNTYKPERVISPINWTRQVMLIKHEIADGPHYVLVRDGFEGDSDDFSEFTLWCLANGVDVQAGSVRFTGQHSVDLTVTVIDPSQSDIETGQYGHTFIANCMREAFHRTNGPDAKWEEIQHYIRIKRTDHKGYFTVLYPHRPEEAVPDFKPWGGGAGVKAMIDGEYHIAVCAEKQGEFSEEGVCFEGRRALVRRSDSRLHLALLSGVRLETAGYGISADGPVAITVDCGVISGEANLVKAGTVVLRLPKGVAFSQVIVATDAMEKQTDIALQDQELCLSLPEGRCRFTLHN